MPSGSYAPSLPLPQDLGLGIRAPGLWRWKEFRNTVNGPTSCFPPFECPCEGSHCDMCFERYTMRWDTNDPDWHSKIDRNGNLAIYYAHLTAEGLVLWDFEDGEVPSNCCHDIHSYLNRKDNEKPQFLFVENLSKVALQAIGVKYHISLDFFDSFIERETSQCRKHLKDGEHFWITFPFLTLAGPSQEPSLEFLGIYMTHTAIICCHSHCGSQAESSARRFRTWLTMTQCDHECQELLKKHQILAALLFILWYVGYAWTEALHKVVNMVKCMESVVLEETNIRHTEQLYEGRGRLLAYKRLLDDFEKQTRFITGVPSPNPPAPSKLNGTEDHTCLPDSMDLVPVGQNNDGIVGGNKALTEAEIKTLILEISRLRGMLDTRGERIGDTMRLVFDKTTISHNNAVRNISYITASFVPIALVTSIFSIHPRGMANPPVRTLVAVLAVAGVIVIGIFFILRLWSKYRYHVSWDPQKWQRRMHGDLEAGQSGKGRL